MTGLYPKFRLAGVKSIIHDDSNLYNRIDDKYIDYFYYSQEGVVTQRHDDINQVKCFTRFRGDLLACGNGERPTSTSRTSGAMC